MKLKKSCFISVTCAQQLKSGKHLCCEWPRTVFIIPIAQPPLFFRRPNPIHPPTTLSKIPQYPSKFVRPHFLYRTRLQHFTSQHSIESSRSRSFRRPLHSSFFVQIGSHMLDAEKHGNLSFTADVNLAEVFFNTQPSLWTPRIEFRTFNEIVAIK